ncbi:MAG: hypothetical protein J6Z49_02435 [Kiritimatiellae bacterium]|nr:hypothetical protein [Kiritimatiellia bacterium]
MADSAEKLQEGIAFFENMLVSMPGDRTSLEFLAMAYEQTGETEKRRNTLVKLAYALLREKEYDKAELIAKALSAFPDNPDARQAVMRIAEATQGQILQGQFHRDIAASGASGQTQDPALEVHALSRAATSTELDLVWRWKERGTVDKAFCSELLRILTDRPVSDVPMTISALRLLDEQHPEWTDRVLETMQEESHTPFIPIEYYEPAPEIVEPFSPVFMQIKAVLPFGKMSGELLVAFLNPFSETLRVEISERAKAPCHFFLAHPKSLLDVISKTY